jgi:uncharacterized protein
VVFVSSKVVAWGEPEATLRAVLEALADGSELISVLAGRDAPLQPAEIAGLLNGGVELELHDGGQPAYWWLLAAE